MEKIVIFGASKYGETAFNKLKDKYNIVGFADNNSSKWGNEFCGVTIYKPNQLLEMDFDKILIASQYYSSINKQLSEMGIKNVYVFCYLGNIQALNKSGEYSLYKIKSNNLFENCTIDCKKIDEILKDFATNYELADMTVDTEKIELSKNTKNVLFCSYAFPPMAGSGIQRSLKFVKYLKKNGYNPIVLTAGQNNNALGIDESLLKEIPNDVEIIRIDHKCFLPEMLDDKTQQEILNLYCGVINSEEWIKKYVEIIGNQERPMLIPDNKLSWANECLKQIEHIVDMNGIDIVYTTGDPFSSFFIAYYLKRKYGIKWVADYRDPWANNEYFNEVYRVNEKDTIHLQKQLENELLKVVDRVVVVASGQKNDLIKFNGLDKDIITVITNGYDEADFDTIRINDKINDKFILCYNGILHADRNPSDLMDIINELIDKKFIVCEDIQFVFNGVVEDKWKKIIDGKDKYKFVKYNGYLSHSESINVAMNSNALILFGAMGEGAEFIYTGKVFEYLRMYVPIICFSRKTGVLADLMEETKAGRNFEYSDKKAIGAYILELYGAWKIGKQLRNANYDIINKYSREYLTEQLADIFDNVLKES